MRSYLFIFNKRNIRERQHNIRLEDTSSRHLWLVNKGDRPSTSPLASGYPLQTTISGNAVSFDSYASESFTTPRNW